MRRTLPRLAALAGVACIGGSTALAAPSFRPLQGQPIAVCPQAKPGFASCLALRPAQDGLAPAGTPAPVGLTPSDLHTDYQLPWRGGARQLVAVVDAFDDPTAESDLAHYRSTFSLAPCSSAGGCFNEVKLAGTGGAAPPFNAGWALEISLDLDAVSAVCPDCRILLVEAASNSLPDLMAGVTTALALGATVVSNSFGAPEFAAQTAFDPVYVQAQVPVVVSSGDHGNVPEWPGTSPGVIAVGGTTLNGPGLETAWSGSGSGCSIFETEPPWQAANSKIRNLSGCSVPAPDPGCTVGGLALAGCARAVADVAFVGDPNTGLAVYSTSRGGWVQVGGTSLSAPGIAGVIALAGGGHAGEPYASHLYAHAAQLHDVTAGSTGTCGTLACNAGPGWDGPTGLGTPLGLAAF